LITLWVAPFFDFLELIVQLLLNLLLRFKTAEGLRIRYLLIWTFIELVAVINFCDRYLSLRLHLLVCVELLLLRIPKLYLLFVLLLYLVLFSLRLDFLINKGTGKIHLHDPVLGLFRQRRVVQLCFCHNVGHLVVIENLALVKQLHCH
jgi:hypothetical protein